MNESKVKNPRRFVYSEVFCNNIVLPLLWWLLLYSGAIPFLQPWHVILLFVLSLPLWVFGVLEKTRGLLQLRPFAPAQVSFNHREFEVRTQDGVATHSWKDVDRVEEVKGSDVTVLLDKRGQAIFAYDNLSSDTTKFSAWLKVFPDRS